MIQCSDCEMCERSGNGQLRFSCDPFSNIKEPECLMKWQILRQTELSQKVDRLVAAYEATVQMYRRLAPLQEKMFRHMQREIDDVEEADRWKIDTDEHEPDSEADADDDRDDDRGKRF